MKIFIAGPRAVSRLNLEVTRRIDNIIENNFTVLVGDANGIDKAIQNYCSEQNYENVLVYATGNRIRNNIGNWSTVNVEADKNIKGFDFYKLKDEQMAKDADYGLMIWNGKSKGTFNNIMNLIKSNKTVVLYLTLAKRFYKINNIEDISELVSLINNQEIKNFFLKERNKNEQLILEM